MFKGISVILAVLMILGCAAVAQESANTARAEIFGGYQFLHATTGFNVPGVDSFNLNGWNAAVSGYVNQYFGVTADFAGSYGTPQVAGIGVKTHLHTFMFGPVVRAPLAKVTPFAHALFGGGHISGEAVGLSASETDFTWAAGGGLDVNVSPHFGLRLAQFDFLQTRVASNSQNHFRYSAGIVLRF
jgi:opacity protein-like surface antigen